VKAVRTCFEVLWLNLTACSVLKILVAELVILVSRRELTATFYLSELPAGRNGLVSYRAGLGNK